MVMLWQITSRSTGRDTALPGAACRSNEYRPTRVMVGIGPQWIRQPKPRGLRQRA